MLHFPLTLRTRLPLVLAVLLGMSLAVSAQQSAIDARVASVHGRAIVSKSSAAPTILTPGIIVAPGDEIDTRPGGRVAIELGDGSLVIVEPGSLVVVQDYRNISSLRELLQLSVGRVRIRINHWGGRPNPYRVNSPTASIAVRGTEFSVAVGPRGDTEVVVFEGVVEVASFADPRHPVLVHPGRGVIVRPNQDIQFFVPGPNNEIGARGNNKSTTDDVGSDESGEGTTTSNSGEYFRSAAGAHDRYFQSIVDSGQLPLASRFVAFPDSFVDSVDNPSYATEFTGIQGQFFVLPSIGGTQEKEGARALLGLGASREVDYSFSPQASMFVALPKYRAVVGGRVAVSHDGLQSFTQDANATLIGPGFASGTTGVRSIDGQTGNSVTTITLIAARRFGERGRTSLGVSLDYLKSGGALLNTTIQTGATGLASNERVNTDSFAKRTRFTVGLTREIGWGTKLGLYYRYGFVSAADRDQFRILNGANRLLNHTDLTGRSSEIGFRLRSPITRRLFYGIEGSYLFMNNDGTTRRSRVVDSNLFSTSGRAGVGFGLGYALGRATVLSLDVSGGVTRINELRFERLTGNLLESQKETAPFVSLHGALQTNLWRRSFVSASVLGVRQDQITNLLLYPDRQGRSVTTDGKFLPNGRAGDRFNEYFGNFGVGWRFNRNFLAEYILSTDFGQTSLKHTFLIRYTYNRRQEARSN